MKKKIIIGIAFIIIGIFLIINTNKSNTKVDAKIEESNIEKVDTKNTNNKIKVDIKGAVKKPGVYSVTDDKRVIDVIKSAGGLNSNANTNYINLSAKVTDEMVIWVYTNSEINKLKLNNNSTEYMIKSCNCPVVDNTTCLSNSNSNKTSNKNSMVNINTANIGELTSLTGIGESKAKSIIEYRTKNGKFKKIEDIMNVTGIGESAYNKIKNIITV